MTSLLSFLRARPVLVFLAAAILLPNLLYLGAMAIGIGTPPRPIAILLYPVIALFAPRIPRVATVAAYLTLAIYDLFTTVGLMFNFVATELLGSVRFSSQLNPLESSLYVALAAVFLSATIGALWLLTRERDALRRAPLAVPLAMALCLSGGDLWLNRLPHYNFGSAVAQGHPFESAARESGFEAAALSGPPRNVLLVIVEGLGVFQDPGQQRLVTAPLARVGDTGRYAVTMGTTTYFGSTTAAELREMCATRASYTHFLDKPAPDCLPHRLAARGMDSIGLHGFSGDMFERTRWWPHMGLRRALFGDAMTELPQCGGVFHGACDPAMAATVADLLRAAPGPLLVYWLTLNTHVPVEDGEHSGAIPCRADGPFGDSEVCDMAGMWHDLFEKIAGLAADPSLPPMEILVVGDHAPPLLDRDLRTMFQPGRVTWIRLAPRPAS
ncbi:hypothetical protein [Iodidimonas sp. SYSU 1G8]|uniref:hypothetical protein n=1 Tax=Iodidimonas sp. SYSU 1G8 TaxID=3133967 RepID=UPI0031FEEA4D